MIDKIEEKWNEIRANLRTVWHDLTATDLETIQTSARTAVAFLKEKYNTTEEKVVEKLEELWKKTKETKDKIL